MLYQVVQGENNVLRDLFGDAESLELYRNGMKSVDQMKALVHHVAASYSRQPEPQDRRAVISQIVEYIALNLDKDLRRQEIAELVHLNPDYLTRFFKAEMGMSLKEYITRQKMNEAKSLLKTTRLPVSIIATKLGYSNFSHFSYTYKKMMGATPLEERGQDAPG